MTPSSSNSSSRRRASCSRALRLRRALSVPFVRGNACGARSSGRFRRQFALHAELLRLSTRRPHADPPAVIDNPSLDAGESVLDQRRSAAQHRLATRPNSAPPQHQNPGGRGSSAWARRLEKRLHQKCRGVQPAAGSQGEAGQNVGLFCRRHQEPTEIQRGQVIAAPRSIQPRLKFQSEVYVLSKGEGGRHTPIFGGYKPQFFFRTTDVTGEVALPAGIDMVVPGDNARFDVAPEKPIALDDRQPFRHP